MKKFCYRNRNPLKKDTNDCVVRAFSNLLNKTWEDVLEELHQASLELKSILVNDDVIECVLNKNGYELHSVNGHYTVGNLPVKEKTLILVKGHATCVDEKYVYDTGDCRRKIVQKFSVKEVKQ